MYNVSTILSDLETLVGFKNHYSSSIPPLPSTLTQSDSGKYVDFTTHPFVNLETISELLPSDLPLDKFLEEIRKTAIIEVLTDLQNIKGLQGKDLLNSMILFDGIGFAGDAIANTGRFCGIRIKPKRDFSLSLFIQSIGLQLTQGQTVDLYVYHSSQNAPLQVINYTTTLTNGFEWENIALQLDAINDIVKGGYYYIGYYQDDLIGMAVPYKKFNFKSGICGTCTKTPNNYITHISPYFVLEPFYVGSTGLEPSRDIFDQELVVFEDDANNYGLNFQLAAKCDWTYFFIDNKLHIADAIIQKIVIKILEQEFLSKQINATQETVLIRLQIHLFGDVNTKEKGLTQKYMDALKMLNLNFSNMNKSCIQCLPEYQLQSVNYGVL